MGKNDDKDRRPADDFRTVHRLPVTLSRKWSAGSKISSFPVFFSRRDWAVVIVEYPDGKVSMSLVPNEKKKD